MGKKLNIKRGFTLKRIDLATKGLVDTQFLGNYRSVFKGTGLEFSEFRDYNPGSDDATRIDWKASKRVGQTLVREFVEERNLEILFLIDVSAHMLTGSTKKLKAEYTAEFVTTLSQSALSAGDSVGYTLFSNQIIQETKPQRGMQTHYLLTKDLLDTSNYKGYTDIDGMLNYAYDTYEEGTLIFLISDYTKGLPKEKTFRLAAKKFDLITVIIQDPRDQTLPKGTGQIALEDPYSGNTLLIDTKKIRKAYAGEVTKEMTALKKLVKRFGSDYLQLETNKNFVKELVKFFEIRAAKWR